jgi:hypothetical protein
MATVLIYDQPRALESTNFFDTVNPPSLTPTVCNAILSFTRMSAVPSLHVTTHVSSNAHAARFVLFSDGSCYSYWLLKLNSYGLLG